MLRATKRASLIALVFVFGACGSSSEKSTGADDLALAKGAVLTDADAPLSYSAHAHREGAGPSEQAKRDFATCLQTDATIFDKSGRQQADGPDFVDEQSNEIDNSVSVYEEKRELDTRYDLLTKPAADQCIGKLFDAQLKAAAAENGAKYGAASVERFAADGVGDRALGFRATVPVTAQGERATVYSDLILAQRGRGAISLVSTGTKPPDHALEIELAEKMSDRLGQKAA